MTQHVNDTTAALPESHTPAREPIARFNGQPIYTADALRDCFEGNWTAGTVARSLLRRATR